MDHKNYSKMSTAPESESVTINPAVAEDEIPTTPAIAIVEPEPEISEPIEGFVSGCERLNVRKEPKINATIVCVLNKDADVIIDVDESTDSFYKVCTEAGAEGYCKKDFITITQ